MMISFVSSGIAWKPTFLVPKELRRHLVKEAADSLYRQTWIGGSPRAENRVLTSRAKGYDDTQLPLTSNLRTGQQV